MTDVVTALQNATAELHNAALLYQTKAGEVAAALPQFQQSAQTIVNNFLNRAPYADAFVDENNGIDAPGRGRDTTPFKTLDYAMDNIDTSVANVFYCLSDVKLNKYRPCWNRVSIVGFARIPSGPYGFPYSYVPRKISFATEAFNSPRTDFGRVPAFLDMQAGGLIYVSMDIVLPALPAGVLAAGHPYLIAASDAQIAFASCTINAEAPSGCAKLVNGGSFQTYVHFASTTIGNNAKGQIFNGVSAGQDPNIVTEVYRSNLKSA